MSRNLRDILQEDMPSHLNLDNYDDEELAFYCTAYTIAKRVVPEKTDNSVSIDGDHLRSYMMPLIVALGDPDENEPFIQLALAAGSLAFEKLDSEGADIADLQKLRRSLDSTTQALYEQALKRVLER